ncbi:MAG: hypothetical protein WBW40_07205, partial [Thermoplasmata archaeon]
VAMMASSSTGGLHRSTRSGGKPRGGFEGPQTSFRGMQFSFDLLSKGDPTGPHLWVPFEVLPNRFEVVMEVTDQVLARVARAHNLRP